MPMQATTTTPLFAAELTPARSLTPSRVQWIVTLCMALIALPGLLLVSTEPWIIAALMVADFVAITGVLFVSLRKGRQREHVTVWTSELEWLVTDAKGAKTLRRFDPRTVRLLLERDANEKTTAIHLRTETEQVEIGSLLGLEDRSTFARALGTALRKARA